jgi:hypothetical protein
MLTSSKHEDADRTSSPSFRRSFRNIHAVNRGVNAVGKFTGFESGRAIRSIFTLRSLAVSVKGGDSLSGQRYFNGLTDWTAECVGA